MEHSRSQDPFTQFVRNTETSQRIDQGLAIILSRHTSKTPVYGLEIHKHWRRLLSTPMSPNSPPGGDTLGSSVECGKTEQHSEKDNMPFFMRNTCQKAAMGEMPCFSFFPPSSPRHQFLIGPP